jgi:hypothetical protein
MEADITVRIMGNIPLKASLKPGETVESLEETLAQMDIPALKDNFPEMTDKYIVSCMETDEIQVDS